MDDDTHEDLVDRGVLAPVARGGAEERLWLDCDLASLAEHRLGDATDPHTLGDARRAHWEAKATSDFAVALAQRSDGERCYWLLEGGARVGTIALGTRCYDRSDLPVASLYVFPALRGRGVGRRALERLGARCAAQSRGFRLETCWAWQRTVRFYLRAGLWVRMWKRDLTMCWSPRAPAPLIAVDARSASLSVLHDGARVVLASARRDDTRLTEVITAVARAEILHDPRLGEAGMHAESTLSLALALAGWPLERSPPRPGASELSDAGPPEALARKIALWEAWDRAHGWRVETPRIPGLRYPTWDELAVR